MQTFKKLIISLMSKFAYYFLPLQLNPEYFLGSQKNFWDQWSDAFSTTIVHCVILSIQLFQLRLSRRQGKRSNMSAKGLSGKTIVLLSNTLPFIGVPLSLKLDLAFL